MKERLNEAVNHYRVMVSISKKAQELAKQNKKYISEFNLPIYGKKVPDTSLAIDEYFDHLSDVFLEHAYMELFATFEAILIEKVQLASGEMSRTLKAKYGGAVPFISYEDRFVKTTKDIGSLNKILELLESKIDARLFSELETIVKYRDKLAHGKRFHSHVSLYSIEDTHKVMLEVLEKI